MTTLNKPALLSVGVREGSVTWQAIDYLERTGHPMGAAVRAFRIPAHRLEKPLQEYRNKVQQLRTEAHITYHAAVNMPEDEFTQWFLKR